MRSAAAVVAVASADAVANKVICKQGWLLGTWLAQQDIKATIQEVLQYLTDGVIVPESGAQLASRAHQFACFKHSCHALSAYDTLSNREKMPCMPARCHVSFSQSYATKHCSESCFVEQLLLVYRR